MIHSHKGFAGILLLIILGVSVLSIFLVLASATAYLGKNQMKYQGLHETEETFSRIIEELNSSEVCTKTFEETDSQEGTSKIENENTKVTNSGFKMTICSKEEEKDNCELCKREGTDIKCSTGVLDKTGEPQFITLKDSDSPTESGSSINTKAILYVQVYSEGTREWIKRSFPIFVEKQKNKLKSCSTSEPALNRHSCKPMIVTKSCCRYRYTLILPGGGYKQIISNDDEKNTIKIANGNPGKNKDLEFTGETKRGTREEFIKDKINDEKNGNSPNPIIHGFFEVIKFSEEEEVDDLAEIAFNQCGTANAVAIDIDAFCTESSWDYTLNCE